MSVSEPPPTRPGFEVDERVPDPLSGERLDRVVAMLADVGRKEAAVLIGGGEVRVGDRVVEKVSRKVRVGERIRFAVPELDDAVRADADVEFDVVHADDTVVVIDKPAGLVVHPGAGTSASTLVHGLLARFPDVAGVGAEERPGLVHRLDKGTSGLLVVARTPDAHADLVDQLVERSVHRVYRALVHGHVASSDGVIDAPLGRSPRDPLRQAVVADGREARTWYAVESWRTVPDPEGGEDGIPVTEVRCELETGRTHQIRVHLAAIGHPVVADTLYGGTELDGLAPLGRPFLHAERLGFVHPATDDDVEFAAPLPTDLTAMLDATVPVERGDTDD